MTFVVTNPHLWVLQARMQAPAHQSDGRWLVLDTTSHRTFVASGKEGPPELIRLLAAAGGGREMGEFVQLGARQRYSPENLAAAGLVTLSDSPPVSREAQDPLDLFQRAAYDYPFRDYHEADWVAADTKLMHEYAKLWPVPNQFAPRNGIETPLPDVDWDTLLQGSSEGSLSVDVLAAILKFSIAPIALIPGEYGALRTFGGGHGVSPPAARSMRSR